MTIYIGCAGWNLRKDSADGFPSSGTHLQRYSGILNCVEINSSFYRPHRKATYERWADSTPDGFRFSVKMPKRITHELRLCDADEPLDQFLAEIRGLGLKLGPILIQLPPSLALDRDRSEHFFKQLRSRHDTAIVCEPRHSTWFQAEAETVLAEYAIERVAADPGILPVARVPGGSQRDCYFRWHGSPRMYYSSYDMHELHGLAQQLSNSAKKARSTWCIFDNTAEGAALKNAVALNVLLEQGGPANIAT